MMRKPINFNQRGAILIFSLVMLLLLTLVGVSMIQHNKLELAMTGNSLQQTKSLAGAETELMQAEQVIDATRLDRNATTAGIQTNGDNKCNHSSLLSENQTILTSGTGTAKITAVYCLSSSGAEAQCTFTKDASNNIARDDIAACTCHGGSEIYTVQWVSFADSNYGAQRTVESKYAVNCSGGQF